MQNAQLARSRAHHNRSAGPVTYADALLWSLRVIELAWDRDPSCWTEWVHGLAVEKVHRLNRSLAHVSPSIMRRPNLAATVTRFSEADGVLAGQVTSVDCGSSRSTQPTSMEDSL